MTFGIGSRKHVVCDEVKLLLGGRENEALLDVAAGTGIVGRAVCILPSWHGPDCGH